MAAQESTPATMVEAEGPDEMIRNARHFFLALGLIGLAFLGDLAIAAVWQVIIEGATSEPPSTGLAFAFNLACRVVAFALLSWLSWMVFRGPRRRAVGVGMLLVGGFLASIHLLNSVFVNEVTGLPSFPLLVGAGELTMWTSVGVAVLGAIEIIWPSRPETPPETSSPD